MSEVDDKLKYNDRRNGYNLYIYKDGVYTGNQLRDKDRDLALEDYFNTHSASNITSRDQIVNPVELLSQMDYGNSAKERKRYQEDLAKLEELQKQQQASYDEWYNSPEQQNIRDREAGLNPDILGLSGSETSQTPVGGADPLANVPSNADRFSSVASGFSSIVGTLSSVASLATAFSTLPLTAQQSKNAKLLGEQIGLQNESLGLQNEQQLGLMMARDISDLLATAQQAHLNSKNTKPFDLDGWFANDDNFAPLGPIYGNNPRYASQLSKQREAVLNHMKEAAASQKDLASSTYGLGQIISSPYYSQDQKLTMIQLKPFTQACAAAESAEVSLRSTLAAVRSKYASGLDIKTAIDVANNQNKFHSDYLAESNGELVAAFEQYLRDVSRSSYDLENSINSAYLDMFKSDPSGEGAWKAAYLYGSNGGASWQEAFLIRNNDKFGKLLDSEIQQAEATGNFAVLNAFATAFNNLNISYDQYNGTPNFVNRYLQYYQKVENLLKNAGYDVDIVE